MLTVSYNLIQSGVCDLAGLDRDNLPTDQQQIIQHAINRRLQMCWEHYAWPEVTNLEKRRYRTAWSSATTYAASTSTTPVEVFYIPTKKYYQSLRGSNLNNVPATLSGTTYTENSDYWAESKESYTGSDWVTGGVYVATDGSPSIIRNPADDRYYQCITAHTAGASFDTAKFIVLTEFDRYVAYEQTGETKIGDVLSVWSGHPRRNYNATPLHYELSQSGVQVITDGYNEVWIEFKTKIPQLTGSEYSATATYTANVDQVYYTDNTTAYPGNFYDCITTTSVGESPVSAAAKWQIVNIPRLFQRYLEQGAFADYLEADGQSDKAAYENAKAEEYLGQLAVRVANIQNQTRPITVLTR